MTTENNSTIAKPEFLFQIKSLSKNTHFHILLNILYSYTEYKY